MKQLILILKAIWFFSIILSVISVYGILLHGVGYVVISAVFILLAFAIGRDYKQMEKEIEDSLYAVTNAIYRDSQGRENGRYNIELFHNNIWYYITYQYTVECIEDDGTSFMGERERISYKLRESIEIIEFDSINNTTGEPYDCGFTKEDIEQYL